MKPVFALIYLLLASKNSVITARASPTVRPLSHPYTNNDRHLQEPPSFQLKMYWQEGYSWRGNDAEEQWCAECRGGLCGEGDPLLIQTCDDQDNRQRLVYEEVPGSGGGRIKPLDHQDLCWTSLGPNVNDFELHPCDNNCRQIIVGIQYAGRFEMNPLGRPTDCLEQHHHPRSDEPIRANDCEDSRNDETSFWVMINKEGDGWEEAEEEVLQGSEAITNLGPDFCSEENKCGLCLGDCKSDADCRDGLACMIRVGNESVAGCTDNDREGNSRLNVCYSRHDYTLPPTLPPTTATSPELYGDCGPHVLPTTPPPNTTTVPPTTTTAPPTTACELDNEGAFGQEASRSPSVEYFYELVTDPALGNDSTIEEITGDVGRNVLTLLLPTLFSDNCTAVDESSGQRHLTNAAVGAKTGPEEPVEEVACVNQFSEDHNCTVVVASITVYTNEDETYDTLLLPVIETVLDSGRLNDAHPAIVNVTYLDKPGDTEPASASENGRGLDDGTKTIVAATMAVAAFVILIFVATVFWRKKRFQSVTAVSDDDEDDDTPPLRTLEVTFDVPFPSDGSHVAPSDEGRADNVPDEEVEGEWPDRRALWNVLSSLPPMTAVADDVTPPIRPVKRVRFNTASSSDESRVENVPDDEVQEGADRRALQNTLSPHGPHAENEVDVLQPELPPRTKSFVRVLGSEAL